MPLITTWMWVSENLRHRTLIFVNFQFQKLIIAMTSKMIIILLMRMVLVIKLITFYAACNIVTVMVS